MRRTSLAKASIAELKQRIKQAQESKEKIKQYLNSLEKSYHHKHIFYEDYHTALRKEIHGRTPLSLIHYYNHYIKECERHIKHHKKKVLKNNVLVVFACLFFVLIIISGFLLTPSFIGYITQEPVSEEPLITEEAIVVSEGIVQGNAVLGEPVVWKKTIKLDKQGKARVNLPKYAEDVVVKKIKEDEQSNKFSITGGVVSEQGFFQNLFSSITGRVVDLEIKDKEIIIEDDALEYEIKYETPAPYVVEEPLKDQRGKKVKIVGPKDVHYENVLSFVELSKNAQTQNPLKIRIYWVEEEVFVFPQKIEDRDNDGYYEYVEWIIPHLSNQTFNIIVITNAEHLDLNKKFISDIYEDVKELDGLWSETIYDEEYVRVVFEMFLDSSRDITIYPRVISGNPKIEIYEVNDDKVIAEFTSLNSNQYNKIYLTNLIGKQDSFDLKVVEGEVEFDHIVDPDLLYDDFDDGLEDGWTENPANRWGVKAGGPSGSVNYWESTGAVNEQAYQTISTVGYENIVWEFQGWVSKLDGGAENLTAKWWDGTSWTTELDITGTIAWAPYGYSLGASADDNANFQIMFICGSGGGEKCGIDEVNVSGTALADDVYPQFSTYEEVPANASNYSFGQSYQFNVSIVDTNGTAGVTFNGTNYTASNVSDEFFVDFGSLSAGNYSYFWWSFGNGSQKNYNQSNNRTYYINETNPTSSLTNDKAWTRDFDGTANAIAYSESNDGDDGVIYDIYKDDVNVGVPDSHINAGTYSYVLNTTGGQNYSSVANLDSNSLVINQITSWVNLTLNASQSNVTIEQGQTIDLNCSINSGDLGAYIVLYREEVKVDNETDFISNSTTFNIVQVENITCQYQDSQNYTINSTTWFVNVTTPSNSVPQITFDNSTNITDISSSGPNEGPSSTIVEVNFSVYDADGYDNLNSSTAQVNVTNSTITRSNSSCVQIEGSGNYANYTCDLTLWWWDGAGNWDVNISIADNNEGVALNTTQKFYVGTTAGFIVSPGNLTWATINPGATNQEPNENLLLNNTGNLVRNIEVNTTDLVGEENPLYLLYAGNFTAHTASGCEGTTMVNNTFTPVSGASLTIGNYTVDDNRAQEQVFVCLEEAGAELSAQSYSTSQAGSWTIRIFMVVISGALGSKRKKKKKLIKEDKLLEALSLITEKLKEEYSLNKKEIVQILLEKLSDKQNITRSEVLNVLDIKEKQKLEISLSIFLSKLGALESLVKYMKENLNMNYREISKQLKRDERTIWTAYKKATEKQKQKFEIKEEDLQIPISIFENKKLTILESLIIYLKDKINLKYIEISKIINRDQRNIWTIYARAKYKLKKRNI